MDEFYLSRRLLRNLKFPVSEANWFVEFGEVLELMENEAAHGQVFVAFGQIEVKEFVGLRYLKPAG